MGVDERGETMQAEVYIDVYLLINMSMDYLCILITARLTHRKTTPWRLLLASAVGGFYAVASLLLGLKGGVGIVGDALVAMGMMALTLRGRGERIWRAVRTVPVFLLVSMILGGVMTALYSLLNRLSLPFDAIEGDGISAWLFALLALVAGLATSRGGRWLGLSGRVRSVTVEAVLFGKTVTLHAMVDTGNLLRDPVSGRGVIVADRKKIEHVLPKTLIFEGREGEKDLFSRLEGDPALARKIRLIPARTATGDGLICAVIPELLTVKTERESYQADYLIAWSALDGSAEGFDAVIPAA